MSEDYMLKLYVSHKINPCQEKGSVLDLDCHSNELNHVSGIDFSLLQLD